MKKAFFACIIIVSVISLCALQGYCMDFKGPGRKLTRGFCNIITSPVELPYRMNLQHKGVGGLAYGFIEGLFMIPFRAVVGVYEIATFPIPLPEKYEPVINDPEFFFGYPFENKK